MDYISTVLFGDENNERYLGKNRIFICTSREQSTYIEKRNIHFPLLISCITYVELHTNYRKVFQLASGKLLWTFLTWMMTKSISCSGVILKDAGGAMTPPDFGKLTLPHLRGADYAQWYMRVQKVKLKVFKKLLFNAFSTWIGSF